MTQKHGGNLDYAISVFGGETSDWLDLSTCINRIPYSNISVKKSNFYNLPDKSLFDSLKIVAAKTYNLPFNASLLPIAGVQTGIQALPQLNKRGTVKILGPTYTEYNLNFNKKGWTVIDVSDLEDLADADIAVIVNPNNPDGRTFQPEEILKAIPKTTKLVVDESYCDSIPELSMIPYTGDKNIIVFRSFGKFFGLAGLRLGFVISSENIVNKFSDFLEPWHVSGPALEVGKRALSDNTWIDGTKQKLEKNSARLSNLIVSKNLKIVGSTNLFHLIEVDDAIKAQESFAKEMIWTRVFSTSDHWLRIGTPGTENEWSRLIACLNKFI